MSNIADVFVCFMYSKRRSGDSLQVTGGKPFNGNIGNLSTAAVVKLDFKKALGACLPSCLGHVSRVFGRTVFRDQSFFARFFSNGIF